MLKLGEYSEDEARDIANYLLDAGAKVDIRTFTNSRSEIFNYLEGRMSELKGEIKEKDFEEYERFINALRAILARGRAKDKNAEFRCDYGGSDQYFQGGIFCQHCSGSQSNPDWRRGGRPPG